MNYECLDLVIPYIPNDEMFFAGLVSREWHTITKKYIINNVGVKSDEKVGGVKSDVSDEKVGGEKIVEKPFKYNTSYNKLVTSNMLLFGMNIMLINPEILDFQEQVIKVGDLEVIESMITKLCKEQVTKVGDLEVINYIITQSCKESFHFLSLYAVRYGHLEIMKRLKTNMFHFESNIFNIALKYKNIDNMKWLHENKYSYDKDTFMIAQMINNFNITGWLNEIGCDLEYYNKNRNPLRAINHNFLRFMSGMGGISYST